MKRILVFLLLIAGVSGCEKTVSDPDWPDYSELLVVRSSVTITPADSLIVECFVRRTLPLWEQYTELKANIPTAKVSLEYAEASHNIPIVSSSNARYAAGLVHKTAANCALHVSNDGKHTSANISIEPLNTEVSSFLVYGNGFSYDLQASIYADPAFYASYQVRMRYKTVDETQWNYQSTSPFVPDRWYNYSLYLKGTDSLTYHTQIYDYSTNDIEIEIAVDAFSREYTEYELSRNSYYNGDEFFGSADKNPRFNFTGDGIGFFWYKLEGEWERYIIER